MKILNQWQHPLCSGYSVLGALQYYEPNLDVNGVLEELHKNTMVTHMAARNWFKSQGLIEDMVQVDDWEAKILLKRGEPILTWGTWVNWQETKVPPFYISWWNDNAVMGHYWYIDSILPWEGDKKNPMTKMANSYWEGWADKGYFYGPLIDPKYKQKWKIIPKKKEEHNSIIRAWVGKSVDVDNYPEYWPVQCIDWVRFYTNTRKRYMTNYGNAYNLWIKGLGKGWERINNTSWAVPQEGDVILWWPTWGGGYGHIAVANKYCNRLLLRYTDQNGGKGKGQGKGEDVITSRFGTYSGVVGWFHWNG